MLSMWDKLWRPDLTEDEALELMRKAVAEVRARLVVAPPKYLVKVRGGPGCTDRLGVHWCAVPAAPAGNFMRDAAYVASTFFSLRRRPECCACCLLLSSVEISAAFTQQGGLQLAPQAVLAAED